MLLSGPRGDTWVGLDYQTLTERGKTMTTPYEQAVRDLKAAREAQDAAREAMLMLKTEWKREDTEESFEAYLKAREAYREASDAAEAAEGRRRGCGSAYTNIRKH